MIVKKDFLGKLKDFGLNSYESKLWTALLSRGISTAGELSDIANVPRSRTYDVLESLEKKGFIVMKLGKPIKYLALAPEVVLENVKKRITKDAEKQVDVLNQLKSSKVLEELNLLHNQGIDHVDPTDYSGCIRGRTNIYNHMESLIKSASKSVIIQTTSDGILRKTESLRNALSAAKKKGVKVKIAAPVTKECMPSVSALSKFADIKHMSNSPSRFIIVDGKHMVFMLHDDKDVHANYDSAVWVTTDMFSGSIENMFNQQWKGLESVKNK